MFKFLPLALAATLAGATPALSLTVVTVEQQIGSGTSALAAPNASNASGSTGLLPKDVPEAANWAFLFGGLALIVALRLGRRQSQVSD